MKKVILMVLLCLALLTACGTDVPDAEGTPAPTPQMQIANPWKSYSSVQEAEAATGLAFPLPETVAKSYTAGSFRVMNGQLMEVIYQHGEHEVIIRMQAGEGLDLSGVYETFNSSETLELEATTVTVSLTDQGCLHLISKDGFSYSLYAPEHYREQDASVFLSYFVNDIAPFQ